MKKNEILKYVSNFCNVKISRLLNIPPSSMPIVLLWITNKCNLKCKMCNQWKSDKGILSEELSTQEWCSIVKSCAKMKTSIISITGGEPFLHPGIFTIIKNINDNGINCHICTNGTLLNKKTINRLAASPPDTISVSFDGHVPNIHNELRGKDCFNTVVDNIKLLKQEIPSIKISINHLTCRRNYKNICKMIWFAKRLGVDQLNIQPIHYNITIIYFIE